MTALLGSTHPGPALAVTLLAALLAAARGLTVTDAVIVTAAVLTGQLSIGWGNDLVDVDRDRAVGRTDKPLASGLVSESWVRGALAAAGAACVVLSLATGWRSGLVHLGLLVAMGHAYNLGLKATIWSWVPYAVAFGSLPAVVSLADSSPGSPGAWPAWWLMAAGAALGVGAHLLNALPDLADDARTGVRGLPHRLGGPTSRIVAAALLVGASLLAALGPVGGVPPWAVAALVAVVALGLVAAFGPGRRPFQAAIVVALLDVVLLVAAG